jgi:hypothetical protein
MEDHVHKAGVAPFTGVIRLGGKDTFPKNIGVGSERAVFLFRIPYFVLRIPLGLKLRNTEYAIRNTQTGQAPTLPSQASISARFTLTSSRNRRRKG